MKDNIDGLMDIVPQTFTQNNEIAFVLQPTKLMSWLKENSDKAKQAKDKLPWLKDIDEFSNPIIAIGKCKE